MRYWMVLVLPVLAGCATSNPQIVYAPMPADLGWSTPRQEHREERVQTVQPERPAGPAEQVVSCDDGTPVKVNVGATSGLALQFGSTVYISEVKGAYEEFMPTDDASPPWKAVIGKHGSKYPIVYLSATKPGMNTSFMISTSQGLCLVDAKSVGSSKVRVVRFSPPTEAAMKPVQKPSLLPDPHAPAEYHGGYTMEPADAGPTWKPVTVVDNGLRTFVVFPRNLSVMSAPMVRMIGANGPELINPVLVGHVMVLDHLVSYGLEFRLGSGDTAEVVKVVRGQPVTISCPGDQACPSWSERVVER